MPIQKIEYQDKFKGYQIIDCVVRSKDIFYFVLIEDYTQWPHWAGDEAPDDTDLKTRVITHFLDEPKNSQWEKVELNGFKMLLAGASKIPKEQYVGVDLTGSVFILGGGENEIETEISDWRQNGVNRGGITKCRTIDGHLYIAGGGRSVGYRIGKNSWKSLTQGMPFNYDKDWRKAGFEDIDGFNANDIYCVGGKGDVWHFNGEKWRQIHFPSNLHLYTICCGGDGQVYISAYGGTTFKGRGDQWKKIYKGEMTIPFKDMVWYEDKVWCTSDYGLWTIENDKLKEADLDDEIRVASGYISTEDGVLLLGGYNGAAYKKDGAWHKIF